MLDEPTAHLDADTEAEVLADLLAATQGRTVLLSTHRVLDADRIDRQLRFRDRRLTAEPAPRGLPASLAAAPPA